MCKLQILIWFLLYDHSAPKYSIHIDTSMADNLYPVIRQCKYIFFFGCRDERGIFGRILN